MGLRLLLGLLVFFAGCATPASDTMTPYAFRLRPNDDLLNGIRDAYTGQGFGAAIVLTCVGSLTRACIRHANQDTATVYEGHFEIVSMTGTLSPDGPHVHLSISDSTGATFGGHLMPGCKVYTTAEVVIADLPGWKFSRETDPTFGYKELKPERK